MIGGLIVDTSWLGWRWCFFVGVPFAVALIVLQKTLHLPVTKAPVCVLFIRESPLRTSNPVRAEA